MTSSGRAPMSSKLARRGVLACVAAILVITTLEFPPPIGFETRPQDNVSILWLFFFLLVLVTEVSTVPLVFLRPALGRVFALVAAALNILMVIADQAHLMQPEVATLGYSMLEGLDVVASLALAYFAWWGWQRPGASHVRSDSHILKS
jgi:hypothetical protein